jgi:histidine ammonia-lyase
MWRSHGEKIIGSDQTWLAIIGPDTPGLGEIKVSGQIYNNQVAMTIANLLKIDYKNPKEGKAILSAITK